MSMLVEGTVVFELRWRNSVPVFGKIGRSKLLGRAEVPWKSVFKSPEMELEGWVVMKMGSKSSGGVHDIENKKPASIHIEMKIQAVPAVTEGDRKRRKWDDECCGCSEHGGCRSCADYEVFALGAALEAF